MKKYASVILVLCVFAVYAAYQLRSAPLVLVVAMTPFFALTLILTYANPDNPDSWTIRFLKRTGFYTRIEDAHAQSLKWPAVTRLLILLATIGWFLVIMKYFPA